MPRRDEDSEIVRIVGPMDQVKQAAHRLRDIVTELAKQSTETLTVPKELYPWIRGVNNEVIDRIASQTGVKINLPPPRSSNETIVLSGEREGVQRAVAALREIHEQKKNVKKMECKVARPQHRFIVGTQRSGLDEIFRETDVHVTVPNEDENSDKITLRGPQERLGDALTLVYSRASSIISVELKYPEWQRKFLLGPKGAKLQQLVPKQDRLNVEFEDGGQIFIEGPPEAVGAANKALRAEIDRLSEEMASEIVKVPTYLHRHIIGRQGALISKIKNTHDVQINIPDERKGSDEIRIEGKKEAVQAAVAEIADHADKLAKKIPKETAQTGANGEVEPGEETVRLVVDIDPQLHRQFVMRNAEALHTIQGKHPGVVISFPRVDAPDSRVHVRGPKAGADAAVKELEQKAAELTRENEDRRLRSYKASIDVPLTYHPRLIGQAGATIRDLSKRFDVHINIPRDNTETITITGYEERATAAKTEIERLVDEWAHITTIPVQVESRFHQRIIGAQGATIRDLSKRFDAAIHIPREKNADTITLTAHEERANKLKAEIERMVEEWSSMVTHEVSLDPRFHPRLIGQRRKNLRQIEIDYKVEVTIPNRGDEDPSRVLVSGRSDESVIDCIDKLRRLEEDFMQDVVESQRYEYRRPKAAEVPRQIKHVEITGAPWQLDSLEQFPSMGAGSSDSPAVAQSAGVWGRR